jgi:hypothetical protein
MLIPEAAPIAITKEHTMLTIRQPFTGVVAVAGVLEVVSEVVSLVMGARSN